MNYNTSDNLQIFPGPVRSFTNYVAHPSPNRDNLFNWYHAYLPQLIYMESIIRQIMEDVFPNSNIKWDEPQIFNNLVRLIYHCSSKYITPYLNDSRFSE